ncbi:MAG: hypothetical protein OXC12_19660 [Spirochaetaceae bacterium]|nr:hypothetical protein [Spirochaetaceae bacterium]
MKLERFAWKTIVALLVGLVGGILLLVLASRDTLLHDIGAILTTSVTMSLIFQLWLLKDLLRDLFDNVRSAEHWSRSGVRGFYTNFHGVPWDDLFEKSDRLSLMVAYARTWRNTHQTELTDFVSVPGRSIEVILPDPSSDTSMAEYGRRFNTSSDEISHRVTEAIEFFKALGRNAHQQSRVTIYLFQRTFQFSFYRFSQGAVIASYSHRRDRGGIITLVADRGGDLYRWAGDEWDQITSDSECQEYSGPTTPQ